MKTKKVAIIDCHLGNLFSVKHACDHVGVDAFITSKKSDIKNADGLILPGVGAFGHAMNNIRELNLEEVIIESITKGKPFFGICLGMQLLFSESTEFGHNNGLGFIDGIVKKFSNENTTYKIKIPQICWNRIFFSKTKNHEQTPMKYTHEGEYMYFVHSYYVQPKNEADILTLTQYGGIKYCSGILRDNIFAVQFHPEKSGEKGIEIYKSWKNFL